MKKFLLFALLLCIKNVSAQNSMLHNKPLQSFSPSFNLKTTTTATCPTSPVGLAAQDSLGTTITNGQTFAASSAPFYIYAPIVQGNMASPCIQTNYANFFTNMGTYGTETFYEGGANIGCIGPVNGGCSFPIGNGAVNGTPWSLIISLLDPSKKHDFVFCRNGSITTSTITLTDCWTGTTLPSNPASTLFSNATTTVTPQACDTLSLPANADIGATAFSIAPTSASVALTDYNDGEAYIHPNLLQPGTYTVTYNFTPSTASGCAMVTGTFIFTIASTLTLTVTSATICAGTHAPLTASGASTYTWTPATGLNITTGASVVANPTVTTIYTVTGTNAAADSMGTATTTVTVNPPPTITYTLVQDVAPHTWDLFYTTTGSTGPYTYSFNWGDGSTSNAAYPSHTYSVAGTYSICATVTDANGCTSTYCENDAVFRSGNNSTYSNMVYINVKSGTAGALAYQKMLADSVTEFDLVFDAPITRLSNPQILNSCFQPFSNIWFAKNDSLHKGKIYKKITDNNNSFQGLMREDTVAKKVYFIPYCDTTESLLYNFALQQGDTITYNFTNSYAGLMSSGVFTVDSVRIKHDYRSYYHRHFYLKNHSVNESTLEMIEGVGNVSHPLFLYYGFDYGILSACNTANFDHVVSCKWDNGHKIYYDSCAYNFAVTSGCFNTTDTCNYYTTCGGINQYNNLNNVKIYPNPTKDVLHIEFEMPNEKAELKLFDVLGNEVISTTQTQINVSSLQNGIYFLQVKTNEDFVSKKIIVQH